MKRITLLYAAICLFASLPAQIPAKLTISDLERWNRITESLISNDGHVTAFVLEPWDGDPLVKIYNNNAEEIASFPFATGISFTSDSEFLIMTFKQPDSLIRSLKLKKTKKEDMPSDMLGVYNIKKGISDTITRIKNYKVPAKWSGWMAYQCEPDKGSPPDKIFSSSDPAESKVQTPGTTKEESEENGYHLYIRNLANGSTDTIPFVTSYIFAAEEEILMCATTGDGKELSPGIIIIDLHSGRHERIYSKDAAYSQLALSDKGERAAFLVSTEDKKDKTGNNWSLCYCDGSGDASVVAGKGSQGIPEGWIINENGKLTFGEKSDRLFFGTSPSYRVKDTTILDEERPDVDVWHYAEGRLHTVQVIEKDRDLKKSYQAVYHAGLNRITQLGREEFPDIQLIDKGDAVKVLALSGLPYEVEKMWEASPERLDVYLIDIMNGQPQKLKENIRASIRVSPAGKYIYWYNYSDSSFYSYDIGSGKEYRLTTPSLIRCYDELNDMPNLPSPYPPAGWLKDDKAFIVADRYDLWSLDPLAGSKPVNLTVNGRKEKISYRLIDLDYENEYIDPTDKQILSAFNEETKESAFYRTDIRKSLIPEFLTGGKYYLGPPLKAKNSSEVIFTRETFGIFPDYLLSDLSFRDIRQITDANPFQEEFLWGSVESVSWLSYDGHEIEGLLYKPADFDPSRKYPMIVNFYEKSSNELYRHKIPEPHRSTIDYHYYTSNGYVIFNPDVHYINGYPGQSAFNCVMPGITSIIEKGFIDDERIGAQGHSWGGYQVAYLATRTDLFAAIESGAPVVNMFSAYGGIRWQTGLNRSFQYEHTQSRIGGTIWEAPHLYWENSPLFAIEKVTTPILIMANDQDGHVPWYQGIEYFIALRRLGKPSWLLNYTGEPHWPLKHPNKVDFQLRMSQFFGHYLKGEPMPLWMKEGVPAAEKDFTTGY